MGVNKIKGSIIDYNGVKGEYNEKSYIHMEESDYEFNLGKDYAEYLMGFRISTLVKDGLEWKVYKVKNMNICIINNY